MYIQINEKAPPAEQIRQLKTQLEIILDNLELESTVTPSTGDSLPEGGTDGQVLTKQTDGSAAWEDPAGGVAENGLPSGGTTDQMLVKNSNTDYDGKWVNQYTHPANHSPAIISQDSSNRFVTDAEISAWNAKQAALGFTPENLANKKTSLTDNSDDYYPTQKAVKSALDGKSNTGHGHAIGDVTNLQTTLDGKSATGHGHSIANVTDLQTTLDGKAPAAKGVPTGGTTDQVLAKNSNTDNDLKWVTPSGGSVSGSGGLNVNKQWMNLWDNTAGSKTTTTEIAKGAYITPSTTIKVWGVNAVIDDTGRDIKFAIYEVNSSGVQQGAALAESAAITLSGKNVYRAIFSSPVILTSGKYYAIAAVLQSGTTLGLCASAYAKDTYITGNNGYITAANTPANGITWTATVGTAPYAIGMLVEVNDNSIPEASFTLPTLATLSTQRAGTGTIEACNYGVRLKAPGTSLNTNSLIYALQSLTEGAGGYRATARIRRFTPLEKWGMMGLILRNSSDGKSVMFGLGNDSIVGFNRNTFTNDTTWASVARAAIWYELDFWIRVVDNLTTRKIYVSKDGNRWQEIYSEAHDTHVAPNQVGVFLNPNFGDSTAANIRAEVSMEVYSWLFETL